MNNRQRQPEPSPLAGQQTAPCPLRCPGQEGAPGDVTDAQGAGWEEAWSGLNPAVALQVSNPSDLCPPSLRVSPALLILLEARAPSSQSRPPPPGGPGGSQGQGGFVTQLCLLQPPSAMVLSPVKAKESHALGEGFLLWLPFPTRLDAPCPCFHRLGLQHCQLAPSAGGVQWERRNRH